jgi:acyl carrier protein
MIIAALRLPLTAAEIEDDAPLFGMGLGLDSLDALEIAVAFELEFQIPTGEAGNKVFRSVNSIVDFVLSQPK